MGWVVSERDPLAADLIYEHYIQFLFENGQPKAWSETFLSAAAERWPALRGMRAIPRAWRAVLAWRKKEPPKRATPFPLRVVLFLIGNFLGRANLRLAAAVAVCFGGYLRPGELLGLRRANVRFSGYSRAILTLEFTKSGQRRLMTEYVSIDDPLAVFLLASWLDRCPLDPGAVVFDMPYSDLRARLRACLAAYDLQFFGFRLYSLRRGGATYDFECHGSFDRSVIKGRWQNIATARIYIADARAGLAALQIPALPDYGLLLKELIHPYESSWLV